MEQNNYYSIKTYSMKHELDIDQFLYSCLDVTNNIITDIWDTLTWKKVKIKNKISIVYFPVLGKINYSRNN